MSPSRLIDALSSHKVEFVVVGGHAVIFHGHLRTTEDLDVVVRRNQTNNQRLLAALKAVQARWISDETDPETGLERTFPVTEAYVQHQHLMMLLTAHGFLDVFDYLPGYADFNVDELFETALEHDGVHYASLSWLRRMKTAAGRHKDLADLENLPTDD